MYGAVRSWKSLIMNVIGTELSVIYPLFKKNCYIWLSLHSIICIHRPVSTKLGQDIYVQQKLNEFDHGSNWTETTGVIWSWIVKNCCIWLCLLSNIYKYQPFRTKLCHNEYEYKISDGYDYGSSHTRSVGFLCPWIEKLNFSSLFGIYLHC